MGPDIHIKQPWNDFKKLFHTFKSSVLPKFHGQPNKLTGGIWLPTVATDSHPQNTLPMCIMWHAKFKLPSNDCNWWSWILCLPMVLKFPSWGPEAYPSASDTPWPGNSIQCPRSWGMWDPPSSLELTECKNTHQYDSTSQVKLQIRRRPTQRKSSKQWMVKLIPETSFNAFYKHRK